MARRTVDAFWTGLWFGIFVVGFPSGFVVGGNGQHAVVVLLGGWMVWKLSGWREPRG